MPSGSKARELAPGAGMHHIAVFTHTVDVAPVWCYGTFEALVAASVRGVTMVGVSRCGVR